MADDVDGGGGGGGEFKALEISLDDEIVVAAGGISCVASSSGGGGGGRVAVAVVASAAVMVNVNGSPAFLCCVLVSVTPSLSGVRMRIVDLRLSSVKISNLARHASHRISNIWRAGRASRRRQPTFFAAAAGGVW